MRVVAEAYRLLSACFCLPEKQLFLRTGVFKDLTLVCAQLSDELVSYVSEMERSFSASTEEALRVEYARLFVGPYELKVPPYGSVYLDGERRLMGESTLGVIQLYEEAGLIIGGEVKEPPDHIAIELEFMYYLLAKEAEAKEKDETEKALAFRKMRQRFFGQYLRAWIPPFCQKIKESSEHPFYLALAHCLLSFAGDQGASPFESLRSRRTSILALA